MSTCTDTPAHPLPRRRKSHWLLVIVCALFACANVTSGESGISKTDIATLNQELAAKDRYSLAPSAIDYAMSVQSLNRKGTVRLGGEFWTKYTYVLSDYPLEDGRDGGRSQTSDLGVDRARLFVDVDTGGRWRAFMSADFTDSYLDKTSGKDADAILREAYLELRKAGHSGFGAKVGKMTVPFGLDRPELMMDAYFDRPNMDGSYLLYNYNGENPIPLPHPAAKTTDPVMAGLVSYEARDIIRAELALFQESPGRGESAPYMYRNQHDPMFISFAAKVGIYPLEGTELSFSVRNRHNGNRNLAFWQSNDMRTDFSGFFGTGVDPTWNPATQQWWGMPSTVAEFGSVSDEQAFAAGLMVEIPGSKWQFYVQYARGLNQGFNAHINSQNVLIGTAYQATPRLRLTKQMEWLRVSDRSWLINNGLDRDYRLTRMWRSLLAAEYEFCDSLVAEIGWQHEWLKYQNSRESGHTGADVIYLGTKFRF